MDYNTSTQKEFWFWDVSALNSCRELAHQAVLGHLADASIGLTLKEEETLLCFYISKIQEIGGRLKYPSRVVITAVHYFKRFYIEKSMMKFNPRVYLITCLFLASKVEENPIAIEDLCSVLKVDKDPVLLSEFSLLEGLKFHLNIFHPQNSLAALKYELKAQQVVLPQEVVDSANDLLSFSLRTDVCFLFPPSQIAIVALKIAAQKKCEIDLFGLIFPNAEAIESFKETESKIKEFLKQGVALKHINLPTTKLLQTKLESIPE